MQKNMKSTYAPIILQGGIVLDPRDMTAQQVQAHAERLGHDHVQGCRARRGSTGPTYEMLHGARPVVQHPALDAVIT